MTDFLVSLLDGWECTAYDLDPNSFPCSANSIEAVSVGIAAGGVALLFTFYLMNRVSICLPELSSRSCVAIHALLYSRTSFFFLVDSFRDKSLSNKTKDEIDFACILTEFLFSR